MGYSANDYNALSLDDFKKIQSESRYELRDLSSSRGVFVRKRRNIFVIAAIYVVLQEELPWSAEPGKQGEKPEQSHTKEKQDPASIDTKGEICKSHATGGDKHETSISQHNKGNLSKTCSKQKKGENQVLQQKKVSANSCLLSSVAKKEIL